MYLVFILAQEVIWTFNVFSLDHNSNIRYYYYSFIGIPVQYLFLFWLYAFKSLNNKKLFYAFIFIYGLTYIPIEFYYGKIKFVNSINLTIGTTLLAFLVVMEFVKQIKNDNILKFKENKMFYINAGVILFYKGTYPYFAFSEILSTKEYISVWNMYYMYFLLSNYAMYLLFAASFIWGKHRLK